MIPRRIPLPTFFALIFFLNACTGGGLEPTATQSPAVATPTIRAATATINPTGLRFIEIPEQVVPVGDVFNPLDVFDFLRYRVYDANEMTWGITGEGHLALTIFNGRINATPEDGDWIGSETVQVEACQPDGVCVQQSIVYSVLPQDAFNGVQVIYVGNAGFLIMVGNEKILIDALFEGFSGGYTLPTDVQDSLLAAEPPFDDIDLILATHNHADHITALMVQQHMETDPATVFLSTSQVVGQMQELNGRLIAMDPIEDQPVEVEVAGIQVTAIYMSHGYRTGDPEEVFNNAYLITIGDFTIFHTGDVSDLRDVEAYDFQNKSIDLAFISHFFLNSDTSKSVIENAIAADYLIPMHYEYSHSAINLDQIIRYYPDAILFHGEMECWFMLSLDQ